MISLSWISGFCIVGEGRRLRAKFALSTVGTVTRVIVRYERLCKGVAPLPGSAPKICSGRTQNTTFTFATS